MFDGFPSQSEKKKIRKQRPLASMDLLVLFRLNSSWLSIIIGGLRIVCLNRTRLNVFVIAL